MTRRLPAAILVTLGFFCLCTGQAGAQTYPYAPRQQPNPYATPPLSPYLNFLRGGDPATNYYWGVLPAIQQRAVNNMLNAEIQDLEQRPVGVGNPEADDLLPTLSGTGHAAQFMNFLPYYNLGPSSYRPGQFNAIPGAGGGRRPR